MRTDTDLLKHINALATDNGLAVRGYFSICKNDHVPDLESGKSPCVLILFGQAGSAVWKSFSSSQEYADGEPDPMDRWSYRIGCLLAKELGGRALFPFEGPPWHPFGQWARRAENIRPSPLGILMHPEFGLWHAYRFAIALPGPVDWLDELDSFITEIPSSYHACDHCKGQPCLTACPVNAFTKGEYDVLACMEYLSKNEQADCHGFGCQARGACPEGVPATYELLHRQFLMHQFYSALEISGNELSSKKSS